MAARSGGQFVPVPGRKKDPMTDRSKSIGRQKEAT